MSFALVKILTAHVYSHEKTWHCSRRHLATTRPQLAMIKLDKRLQVIPLLLISEQVHTPPVFSRERLIPLQYKALCTYIIIVYEHVPTMAWTAILVNINDIL